MRHQKRGNDVGQLLRWLLASTAAHGTLFEQRNLAIHANNFKTNPVFVIRYSFAQTGQAETVGATEVFIARRPSLTGFPRSPLLDFFQ